MKRLLTALVACLTLATTLSAQTADERRAKIQEHERKEPSKEASERKARSVARLRQEGVPTIEHLPVIGDSTEAKTRSADEIAKRAVALCLVAIKGEGADQAAIDKVVRHYGAKSFFTPKEAAFIKNPDPTQEERNEYSWRYEHYWVLLWALGYVDTLGRPDAECDVPGSTLILKNLTTAQFIQGAKLRPLAALLDEADLAYRYDWAATNALLKSQDTPAALNGRVAQERHRALNWLIGYLDQAWDDVTTDT